MATVSYHVGWDYFTPDPGSTDKMFCKVCETEMLVRRNVDKPTAMAEAQTNKTRLHDVFYCKFSSEDWHLQTLALKRRIESETSQAIADLLQEELNEVLKTKQTTRALDWKTKVW
jgi:hypothetical protein